ncbi:hypothetical protein ACIQB5_48440 [Streptomyces sp. NPDC088560]|uniref:hypothetical protein n=1 Tax=Streptomyces sp. NPDC088560 TaxID=3365868 RepID=UPI00380168A9
MGFTDMQFTLAVEPFDPGSDGTFLLNTLMWCVTAAGIAGIIIIGTLMALQLHRGEIGEKAQLMRGLFFVLLACVVATSAGPIISFLGPFTL